MIADQQTGQQTGQRQTGDITGPAAGLVEEATLTDIVTLVWDTFVGGPLVPVPAGPPPAGPCATIAVGGPWTATIAVSMSDVLVVRFAAAMLGLDPAALDPADVDDALGELANVVGGNVKGLVDGVATTLSLPAVSHTRPSITGGQLTVTAAFDVDGEPMVWELFERP